MLSANASAVHPVNIPSSRIRFTLPRLARDRKNWTGKNMNFGFELIWFKLSINMLVKLQN